LSAFHGIGLHCINFRERRGGFVGGPFAATSDVKKCQRTSSIYKNTEDGEHVGLAPTIPPPNAADALLVAFRALLSEASSGRLSSCFRLYVFVDWKGFEPFFAMKADSNRGL
jgi:hypothetical protein